MLTYTDSSKSVCNMESNDCSDAVPRRLSRSRSMEDLSREQLKNTESATVRIFLEYVRNKVDKSTARAAQLEERIEREQRERHTRQEGRRKKVSLRRLQSEPNGPKTSEFSKPGAERSGLKRVEAYHCRETSPRPTRLVLERPPSDKTERKRRASATKKKSHSDPHSDNPPERRDSGITFNATPTTPVPVPIPDPPITPCDAATAAEFSSSYPPVSTHRSRAVSSPVIVPPVVAGAPISQDHYCISQQPLTPQMVRSRDSKWLRKTQACIIANRLKMYGDKLSSAHEEELQQEIAELLISQNPRAVIQFFSIQLHQMLLSLTWQNIGKVFHLSYHLIEFLTALLGPSAAEDSGSPEWAEFSQLWDFTLGTVTRWISSNGGWGAFPADSSTPNLSPEQHTCPATPSFRRMRSRLLSLSESGEFVDEEGHPHSADTISIPSPEPGLSDEREEEMGSSVDLLQDPLEGLNSESSLTTSLPQTITPHTVPPPCSPSTLRNGGPTPLRRNRDRADSGNSRMCQSADFSTVAFSNGIPQLGPRSRSEKECSSASTSHQYGSNRSSDSGELRCTGGVPTNTMQRNSAHRTSQTALNGLVIGVGGAAVVYAAVSALLRR